MANGNPDVYMGSQGTPSRPVKWLTREKDGPWLSCFNLSASGRARRTETAKATRRHPQLDAEKARSLELKAADLDSLLFPAPVGREFAPDSRNSYAISDAYIASGWGKSGVLGDFPAKLPEARDFPYRDRFCWTACTTRKSWFGATASATRKSAQTDVISYATG
jgi:hypothetical protein